jgi:glutathione S-transferase
MNSDQSLRLRYFDFPGRAEAIRDALRIGRIDFIDERLTHEQFGRCREAGEFPFGGVPVMVIETDDGTQCVSQSSAILHFAGHLSGLYPSRDPLLALKVDEVFGVVEDIGALIGPSLHEADIDRRMAMRRELAEETLPYWMGCLNRFLLDNGYTGYLVGDELTVADLRLYWLIDWLTMGILDGIPTSLIDGHEQLLAWRDNITAVRATRLAAARE